MLKASESWRPLNAQKQRELEREKAQNAALQTYLDQMGQMLLNEDLRTRRGQRPADASAGADTVGVRAVQCGGRIALVFLHEATSH